MRTYTHEITVRSTDNERKKYDIKTNDQKNTQKPTIEFLTVIDKLMTILGKFAIIFVEKAGKFYPIDAM